MITFSDSDKIQPTSDDMPLYFTIHTPEMWERIFRALPNLIKKLNKKT